jgi:hypothetical protein
MLRNVGRSSETEGMALMTKHDPTDHFQRPHSRRLCDAAEQICNLSMLPRSDWRDRLT